MNKALLACLLFALSAAGCYKHMWWDYRDDPYLAEMSDAGEKEALKNLASVYEDERQIALRVLADMAARARREGRKDDSERIVAIIIGRYQDEKSADVRLCIITICAPVAGIGSPRMVEFLKGLIASGQHPGAAALSLAALRPPGTFESIAPLTRHPAHLARYQAATALTVLGDPRGAEPVRRVLAGMQSPQWPNTLDGVSLQAARESLSSRAARAFGGGLQ